MKLFPFSNTFGEHCPICGTDKPEEATLIPMAGTEVGNNVAACQVHTDCLRDALWYYKTGFIIAPASHPIQP